LLYKNVKIKIYRTIILSVVLYGCETLSLALREEHRLRFKNRVLRNIRGGGNASGGDYITRSFVTYILHQYILFRRSNQDE
jgi:hypothetical protein